MAHYLGEDESDAIDYARTVLAYLPSNSESKPPVYAYAVTRAERETAKRLATIVPTNERQPYDMLEVIRCIVDYGEFVQVQELFGASALVGFACIDGKPVGIVANQPNVLAGIWTSTRPRKSPDSYACATRSTCPWSPSWMCPATSPAPTRNTPASSAAAPR